MNKKRHIKSRSHCLLRVIVAIFTLSFSASSVYAQSTTCDPPSIIYQELITPTNFSPKVNPAVVIGQGRHTWTINCQSVPANTSSNRISIALWGIDTQLVIGDFTEVGRRGVIAELTLGSVSVTSSSCVVRRMNRQRVEWSWDLSLVRNSPSTSCTIVLDYRFDVRTNGDPIEAGNLWEGSFFRGSPTPTVRPSLRVFGPNATPLSRVEFSTGVPPTIIIPSTVCTIRNSPIIVNLPDISTRDLVTTQVQQVATAGTTPFQIDLDGCTFPSNVGVPYTAAIRFSYFATSDPDILNSLSGALEAKAQILSSDMVPIPNGGDVRLNIPNAGGVFSVQLYARWVRRGVGTLRPGLYRGDVVMTLGYL